MSKKEYNVLDLFCGAGGLSRGFIDAGFSLKFFYNLLNSLK